MVLVVSTSSPLLSVAAFEGEKCIDFVERLAPRSAGGILFEILEEFLIKNSFKIGDFEGFVTDIGPGSFTGVKVGVTVIKSAGYLYKKPVQGVLSFDLLPISPIRVISVRKGKYFVKDQKEVVSSEEFPGDGMGYCLLRTDESNIYPSARGYIDHFDWLDPIKLNPLYMEDPNISLPKVPYGTF